MTFVENTKASIAGFNRALVLADGVWRSGITRSLATDRYLSRGERSMRRCSPSLAAGTAAILCAAHRRPGTGVPNILNNEKVFTVFQGDLVSRSTFFPRIRCVLSVVGMGWLTYLYEPLA